MSKKGTARIPARHMCYREREIDGLAVLTNLTSQASGEIQCIIFIKRLEIATQTYLFSIFSHTENLELDPAPDSPKKGWTTQLQNKSELLQTGT